MSSTKAQVDDLLVCAASGCCCGDICSLYTKFPECCGYYCSCAYCCYNQETTCCKPSTIDHELCVCCECRQTEIMPYSCCKGICQNFCCDYRFSCPLERGGDTPCITNLFGFTCCLDGSCTFGVCETVGQIKKRRVSKGQRPWEAAQTTDKDDVIKGNHVNPIATIITNGDAGIVYAPVRRVQGRVESKDLNVCYGDCCSICSLFTKFPDVFGYYNTCTCCCCKQESLGCKPAVEKGEIFLGDIKISSANRCSCIMPSTCCDCISQCYICDYRCAIPCSSNQGMPCLLNICFINCCYQCQCKCGQTLCKPLGTISGEYTL